MLDENKEKSIEYWNNNAKNWKRIAYNPEGDLSLFPTSQVRNEVVINELIKLGKKNAKILDIGCADGRLIRDMLKAGFTQVKGIDNSEKMIVEAKSLLKEEFPELNQDNIFFVEDADKLSSLNEKFDYITAIGLIEYVKDINSFFVSLHNLLVNDGLAFIESRNKLFNLFSANHFTSKIEDIPALIEEINSIKNLSPVQDQGKVVLDTFQRIGNELNESKINFSLQKNSFEKYPFNLPQYTPLEFVNFCEKNNLKTNEIIYYHCHPFAPKYESEFTQLFNKLGIMMQPLGYTPLGALICSSFVAKVRKK